MNRYNKSNFASILSLAETPATRLCLPVLLAVLASLAEGAHVAILIPFVEGIFSFDFQSFFQKPVLENFFPTPPSNKTAFFIILCLIFVSSLAKHAFQYIASFQSAKLIWNLIDKLRQNIFDRFISASKTFYDSHSSGTLQQVLVTFTQTIGDSFLNIQGCLTAILISSVYIFVMVSISWQLTMVISIIFPFLYYLNKFLIKKMERNSYDSSVAHQNMGKKIFNVFSCISLVNAYSQAENEKKKFNEQSNAICRAEVSFDKKSAFITPFQEMITLIVLIGLIIFIAKFMLKGSDSNEIAKYLVFFYVMRRSVYGFGSINQIRASLARTKGPMASIVQILEEQKKHHIPSGDRPFEGLREKIFFDNVTFGYGERKVVLKNLSLSLAKGESVALVGPTGAGKSTIVSLLMRFYDCPPNSIFIDGVDIREFSISSFRERIAYVGQNCLLFNDTLKMNLTYGIEKELSDDVVKEVIKDAQLESFVNNLPKKLETLVGDRGVQLSGGEKQRLSIARAMLKNAELLILDEATSSLDTETETLIQAALHNLMKGKTAIVIAHRLATIRNVNKIFFIEGHKVSETGSFDELIKKNGRFQQFWQKQGLK